MKISKTLQAHFALFFVMLIYGANYTISKEVTPQFVSPLGVVMMRVMFGAVTFWVLHLFVFPSPKIKKEDFKLLLICAFFGAFINQIFFFLGLSMTAPINAAVIMLMLPIIVFLGAVIFFKEKFSKLNIFGIGFGCLGALLIILASSSSALNMSGQFGDILILINACCFGAYLLMSQPLVKKYDNIVILKWIFTFGTIYCIPFCMPDLLQTNWATIPTPVYWYIGYILVFVTVFAYLFYAFGLQHLPSTVVGTYVYTQPVIAAIIAIAAGKDELTVVKIIAATLIFFGVYLASKKPKDIETLKPVEN